MGPFHKQEYANSIQLVFMLPHKPRIKRDLLYLQAGAESVKMMYDSSQWNVSWEMIPIEDSLLNSVWGDKIYRLLLEMVEPSLKGEILLTLGKQEKEVP